VGARLIVADTEECFGNIAVIRTILHNSLGRRARGRIMHSASGRGQCRPVQVASVVLRRSPSRRGSRPSAHPARRGAGPERSANYPVLLGTAVSLHRTFNAITCRPLRRSRSSRPLRPVRFRICSWLDATEDPSLGGVLPICLGSWGQREGQRPLGEPLRHDALQTELAGMPEHGGALLVGVLAEAMRAPRQQPRQLRPLALPICVQPAELCS
jgi:hypothetical protein